MVVSGPRHSFFVERCLYGLTKQAQTEGIIYANSVTLCEEHHQNAAESSVGERLNAITALSSAGIVAAEFTKQTVTGEAFFDFLRGILIPRMRPFDGINPHSVLVLDNCTVHHVQDVKDLLQQVGIVALFLPPYSPDLMPLEEAFSFVKYYLKKHDELLQTLTNPIDVIRAAFDAITSEHCNAWITHAGYI